MKKIALALVAATLSTVHAVPVDPAAERAAAKPAVVQPAATGGMSPALGAPSATKTPGTLTSAAETSSMPEPSTFAMMALGLGLIGLTLGRRRNPR